jgi:hypothetical protein
VPAPASALATQAARAPVEVDPLSAMTTAPARREPSDPLSALAAAPDIQAPAVALPRSVPVPANPNIYYGGAPLAPFPASATSPGVAPQPLQLPASSVAMSMGGRASPGVSQQQHRRPLTTSAGAGVGAGTDAVASRVASAGANHIDPSRFAGLAPLIPALSSGANIGAPPAVASAAGAAHSSQQPAAPVPAGAGPAPGMPAASVGAPAAATERPLSHFVDEFLADAAPPLSQPTEVATNLAYLLKRLSSGSAAASAAAPRSRSSSNGATAPALGGADAGGSATGAPPAPWVVALGVLRCLVAGRHWVTAAKLAT